MNPKLLLFSLAFTNFLIAQSRNIVQITEEEKIPNWEKSMALGLNLSHTLNVNAPTSAPKQGFGTSDAVDLGLNFSKDASRFRAQNELHWTFTFFKASLKSPAQNTVDALQTLHDFSVGVNKSKKWNVNIIFKTETPIYAQFDDGFLKDQTGLGLVQKFVNPLRLNYSPGIKYQPTKALGISVSPYSVQSISILNPNIVDRGIHIEVTNPDGTYKSYLFEKLGAEANIWYTKKYKKKVDFNYRINISSKYAGFLSKDARIGGTFITKFMIYKGLALSHRAILKGDFSRTPFKPYYNQVVLLAYTFAI